MADSEISEEDIEFTGKTLYMIENQVEICLGRFRNAPEKLIVIKKIHTLNRKLEKLQREVVSMFELTHPSIPKFYGYYWDMKNKPAILCILLEYFPRGDLEKEILNRIESKNPWSENELLYHFGYLIEAFAYMENSLYSHRDIKPKNIFIADDGTMKIGDFGCSIQSINHFFKVEATISGSPIYLSPILRNAFISYQQGRNKTGIIAHNVYKSDVYSLGLTFLYMVSLKEPIDLINLQHLELLIKSRLKQIKYRSFKWLLSLMLKVNENERPNFIELYDIFNKKLKHLLNSSKMYAENLARMVNTKSYLIDKFNISSLKNSRIMFKVKISNKKLLDLLSLKCNNRTINSTELEILSYFTENQLASLNLKEHCKECSLEIQTHQIKIQSNCLCGYWMHKNCINKRLAAYGSFMCDVCNNYVIEQESDLFCPNIECYGRIKILSNENYFSCRECNIEYCKICKVDKTYHMNYYCTQLSLNDQIIRCGKCGDSDAWKRRGSFYYHCRNCGYLCIVCYKEAFETHKDCCTKFTCSRFLS